MTHIYCFLTSWFLYLLRIFTLRSALQIASFFVLCVPCIFLCYPSYLPSYLLPDFIYCLTLCPLWVHHFHFTIANYFFTMLFAFGTVYCIPYCIPTCLISFPTQKIHYSRNLATFSCLFLRLFLFYTFLFSLTSLIPTSHFYESS